ncbi:MULTISPECIES: hypothetical protein [Burkholderia]|uniref:hypothetical protein n=1 Tax=Burkholderia TaxID=32008 RepID=UPI00075721E8|nr:MULTISPECIES: hypothetical protein [Burkholderia]AOJ73590.1 hypothetical protein WS78_31195 [Burkholderia savannae]KVG41203.1 hypothetical protein WS77_17415 [Burkholderia sp. MSMB0265]KVG81100.1 hypothetical protein WS81_12070 [Burkholderia sp. MSMB2040]KVG95495.1 hypothetical protein WS82_05500 [Burkholderia sp. MSMB2041]KVG96847.1 hypothetical protein WS83_02010 [Burkholderia sp. MSMB2042]
MKPHVAGWQLDMFGGESPILISPTKPDPLPDPSLWEPHVREKLAEAVIFFALDSRHSDNVPEALIDCAEVLHQRLCNRTVDKVDYYATLGWIMELWTGAIPYQVVCALGRVRPRTMQDAIRDVPLLNYDFNTLNRWCSGQLSLEAQWVA